MVFPATPLDVTVEAFLGTWTDIKGWVFDRDSDYIQIARGRRDWASQTDPSTARMTLNNVDGRFSPRNPIGPYYGQLGRNTPLRASVRQGAVFLELPGADADKATAPDVSALGITGDIDVRMDITMSNWRAFTDLAAKYEITGNQRSWFLYMTGSGLIKFRWSADGTVTFIESASTSPVPSYPGRLAVRVTLDVNNGASGNTATFYTAPTLAGPWTQLGDPVVTAGTTAIFDSTAVLELGSFIGGSFAPLIGRVHAFELRSGIGGTAVANPDFSVQTAGATTFADTASPANTWTVAGAASITNRHWRHHGEVSEWPVSWDASGADVYTTIESSGILRRLGQGSSPLRSTLNRSLTRLATPAVAYWSCEDAAGATSIASGIGGPPMLLSGTTTLATNADFQASAPLPALGDSATRWKGEVPNYTGTGSVQVRFLCKVPSGGSTTGRGLVTINTAGGTVDHWNLVYGTTGTLQLQAFDSDGSTIFTGSVVNFLLDGKAVRVSLELAQNGSNIDFNISTLEPGASSGLSHNATVTSASISRATRVTMAPHGGHTGVVFGHISVQSQITNLYDLDSELNAYIGETAGRRVERLCSEEGITFRPIGNLDDTEAMGAQATDTLLTLLSECADADMGVLYEPRDVLGLGYRTRASLYSQTARIELDYAAEHFSGPLDPVDDDQLTRNDVTVTRTGGSSARVEVISGPLSVQDPPDGAGRYDDAPPAINVQTDVQLPNQASWRALLGTTDEARYPSLQINLASDPIATSTALTGALLDHELGDRLTADHPPAWLAPDQISQLVQGYGETLRNFEHRMTLTATPESPFRLAVLDDLVLSRAGTTASSLAASATSTATSLSVATTSGSIWTTSAGDMPFDLAVGGERMTVTAVASSAFDAFGRTAANGWGTADSGQTWTNTGGAVADQSVSGGLGRHAHTATAGGRFALIPSPGADVDITATIASDVTPAGASHLVYLMLRATGTVEYYLARVEFTTASAVIVTIRKRFSATETQIGSAVTTALAHAASTRFAVRFKAYGSTLMAKVWLASASEPDAWTLMVTDTDITTIGSVGFRSFLAAGNSNTLPVTVTFDNLALLNPQTMTVTRSVNGIVKAQTSGADVRLWQPMVLAL